MSGEGTGGTTPTSPYEGLERRAFWRSAVSERSPLDPGDIYRPKFPVTRDMRIVTAGSCFAQHIGRALKAAEFNVVDTERFPGEHTPTTARRFGYDLFSARYGNIYTARHLLQLLREARGRFEPAHPVWERDGRYCDSQRPSVEPEGLDSAELVSIHRALHLANVRRAFFNCDLLIFTFGLTEAWIDRESGTVYPTAPGTIAGHHDSEIFEFHNFGFDEVLKDFDAFLKIMRSRNPGIRVLVTTSPVPLTATASGEHVEVANAFSKSVLRAVCGTLAGTHDDVDYFPSYEIITSSAARGAYFEANLRSVAPAGVETAMTLFLAAHGIPDQPSSQKRPPTGPMQDLSPDTAICEDVLLEAFAE